ncbi:MAG: Uma2 family endonuclease [Pyrinomonadaceae bacterium]
MTTHIQPLLTIADLDSLPEDGNRYELIDGDLYVSRAPHINHQFAISNLLYAIKDYLNRNPIGKVIPEPGVIFSDYDAVIPDVVYVSNERFDKIVANGKFTAAPDLVIEILSPGSENERRDRNVKRRLYSVRGVREYWIVDVHASVVEIYRPQDANLNLVATLSGEDEITTSLLPGFICKVAKVFEI